MDLQFKLTNSQTILHEDDQKQHHLTFKWILHQEILLPPKCHILDRNEGGLGGWGGLGRGRYRAAGAAKNFNKQVVMQDVLKWKIQNYKLFRVDNTLKQYV